jgi:peptidoglycan/xylan/chitin deacetylase (PgdA/CDA1 family)
VIDLPRLRAAASRLATHGQRRATVLLYHRIAVPDHDPWSLAVSPTHFAEHMQVLRKHAEVAPLSRLRSRIEDRRAPRSIVAVTFDDGYADNTSALAALEHHEVPATIFVIAGALGTTPWWDRLASLLLDVGKLPEHMSLVLGGTAIERLLGGSASYDREAYDTNRGWRAGTEPPTPRHALYMELWRLLQPMRHAERERALDEIGAWAHATPQPPDARLITQDELGALAAHPLIDVGGHTISHPRLSALTLEEQREEIAGGKRVLEEIVGARLTSFAYPFGRPEDLTSETVSAVRDAGFDEACANYSGTVRASSDRYRLPRAYVHDCDGDEFERRLTGWLDAPAR